MAIKKFACCMGCKIIMGMMVMMVLVGATIFAAMYFIKLQNNVGPATKVLFNNVTNNIEKDIGHVSKEVKYMGLKSAKHGIKSVKVAMDEAEHLLDRMTVKKVNYDKEK